MFSSSHHKRKINWTSLISLCILSSLVIFTLLIYAEKKQANELEQEYQLTQSIEAARQKTLAYELYELEQYQITNYNVGKCEGECSTETFTIANQIKSCEARVRIDTIVLDDVEIVPELRFRIVSLDDSFEYVDDENKIVVGKSFNVEERLKEITLFPIAPRPADWFCLPPGRYQEQVTVNYTYQNEVGFKVKNPTYISNIFEIIE
jgi:hypothetical protein